jgi:putative membrane protein
MAQRNMAVAAAIGVVLGLASCEAATPQDTRYASQPREPWEPGSGMQPASRAIGDGELASITDTLSNAWLEQARVAHSRARDPAVRDFALMELENHGQLVRKQSRLESELSIAAVRTPFQENLSADGARWTARLLAADAEQFDRVYLEHLVSSHSDALTVLDERVLPRVRDPELRALFEEYRSQIAAEELRMGEVLELRTSPPEVEPTPETEWPSELEPDEELSPQREAPPAL